MSHNDARPEAPAHRTRGVMAVSALAMLGLGIVTLRQLGVIKHLPDPPGSLFDSNRIVMSRQARKLAGIPDGILGLGSYGATLGLAVWDFRRPSRGSCLTLAAKIVFDVSQALSRSVRQWPEFGCLCSWCLLPVSCSILGLVIILPEANAALRALRFKSVLNNHGSLRRMGDLRV